ncbi:MAG: YaeQ family protein [Elusimicrobiota bacterium]
MNIRANLAVNGDERSTLLVGGPNELDAHLAHKLAAYILFWDYAPLLDASVKTPTLADYEFLPDLLALDDAGEGRLWVECGTTTLHKLTKITRRMPRARLVIMKETERDAARLRKDLEAQFDRPEKVEILAWPGDSFKQWVRLVAGRTEAFGEASGHMINAVVNDVPVLVEFKPY